MIDFFFYSSKRYYSKNFNKKCLGYYLFCVDFFPFLMYCDNLSGPQDLWGWQWCFIFIEFCTRGFLVLALFYCVQMINVNSVNSFKLHVYQLLFYELCCKTL